MADNEHPREETPPKRSKLSLLLGLLLALAGGGGGFFAAYSGVLAWGESSLPGAPERAREQGAPGPVALPDVDFVAIAPLVISLGNADGTYLRFRAQLEVPRAYKSEVEHLLPRVVDVLNGYLRAVDLADLKNNAALVRLRAQMLRRVQVVTGADRVRDLLVMEFVLN